MSHTGREPGWTLRRRLQAIITFALLPVVLVSIFQGVARARLDITNVHDRLIQQARSVAESDQNLLSAAEQVLRAVASLSEVRGMNGDCDRVLYQRLLVTISTRTQLSPRSARLGMVEQVPFSLVLGGMPTYRCNRNREKRRG